MKLTAHSFLLLLLLGGLTSPGTAASRELLLDDRTYYVSPAGDNGADGLSPATAWRDVQFAVDFAATFLDTGRSELVIHLEDGVYPTGVILRNVPGDLCPILEGNVADPDAVTISHSTNYAILIGNDRGYNRAPAPATWTVRWLRATASGAGNRCIVVTGTGTRLNVDAVNFGSCAAEHMVAEFGGLLSITGPYRISGGATRHIQAFTGGQISFFFGTITLVGTPHFSSAFARTAHAGVIVSNPAGDFIGNATGKRYEALLNGVIDTQLAGATYFPGHVAGTTASGGHYQ